MEVQPPKSDSPAGLLDVGWIVVGELDEEDRRAVQQARDRVQQFLAKNLSEFTWRMPIVQREEGTAARRLEPTELFDCGTEERSIKRWDFVLLITAADLVSHYKSDTLAALSRSLEMAVISTSRIEPRARRSDANAEQRVEVMSRRLATLAIHAIGHWGGLNHHESADNYLFDLQSIDHYFRHITFVDEEI